jgi:hypothetical protein
VPEGTWVSRIEPSSHEVDRFFVTFDGHRTNDFMPYVYVTEDGGDSFRSITSDLPTGAPDFVHVIREDPTSPDLLFVGTDVGVYVSTNRGGSWQRFMTGFPTVPVHDLRIHPRDRDLIAGTHGRAIWIVDIAPLQQMTTDVVADGAALFEVQMPFQYGQPIVGGGSPGHLWFQESSPGYGAEISYWLAERVIGARAEVIITDASGDTVHTTFGTANAGLQRVTWNFQGPQPPRAELTPAQVRDSVRVAHQLEEVADSMVEGGVPRAFVDRVLGMMQSGDRSQMFRMFGGGGGRPGGAGGFNERPGERFPPQRAQAGAGAEAREGQRPARAEGERAQAGGEQGMMQMAQDPTVQREMMRAFRRAGPLVSRFLFGGGGRGQAPILDPGDFTVTVKIGDRVMTKDFTVIRASGTGGSSSPF